LNGRSNYKSTWNALAPDETAARLHVAGHTDNAEWERSAQITRSVLRDFVGLSPADDALEIGCGMGRVGRAIAGDVRSWTGADISSGMLACAKTYLDGIPNLQLVELSDVGLSEFADASMDLVYCTVVFMHLFEWDRFRYVSEAFRVLRPGGRCYFDNVDITTDHGWKVFEDGYRIPREQRPDHLSATSSADELETYGRRAGFAEVQVRRWGGAWVALTGRKPQV
jgi:SAM-dependent methyltransferase